MKVQDYDESLQNSVLTACVEYIGNIDMKEICVDDMNISLTTALQAKARGWGIDIQAVGLTDIGRTKNIRLLGNEKVVPLEEN